MPYKFTDIVRGENKKTPITINYTPGIIRTTTTFIFMLTGFLIFLKTGIIESSVVDWSWFWITFPIWFIPAVILGIVILILMVFLIIFCIMWWLDRRDQKKLRKKQKRQNDKSIH